MSKIKIIDSPEGTKKVLSKELGEFVNKNKPFNVQGAWTGDDGVKVNVLADFGIEDYESGDYYVVSAYANIDENMNVLNKKSGETDEEYRKRVIDKLKESDALLEAEDALQDAIDSVFDVPYGYLYSEPEVSDIDVSTTIPVVYGEWDVRKRKKLNKEMV